MDSKAINKEMYALYIDYMCRLSGENLHQILQNFGLNRRPNERLPLYKRTSRRNASISSSSTSSSSSSTGVISKVTKMATANLSNPVQNLMQNYQLQLHANHQSDKRVYIHHQEQTLAQYQQYNYSRAYTAYEVLPREYLCPEEVLYQNMLMDYCFSIPEDQRDFLLECFGLHKEPHQRVPLYNRKPSSIYLVSLAKLFDEDISTHLHFQGPYCNAALFPNEKPNVFGKQIIEREDEEVLLGDWFYNKCTEIKIIKYKRDFQFDEVELIDPGLRKYVWSPFSQRPFFELNNFEGSKRIFDITLQAPFNTCFHCDQRISFERGMSTILIIQTTMESDSQHSAQKPSKKRKKAKEKKSDENFPKHVSMQIPPFSKAQTKKHCSFCRKNGEKAFVYETHNLKGLNGDIICPILSKHRCEICGATGNYAHTKKYCPINVENPVDLPRFRLLANGTISDSHFHK